MPLDQIQHQMIQTDLNVARNSHPLVGNLKMACFQDDQGQQNDQNNR